VEVGLGLPCWVMDEVVVTRPEVRVLDPRW
jgi:hypothetical protein